MSDFEIQVLDYLAQIKDINVLINDWVQYLLIAVGILCFGIGYLVGRK